MVAATCPNCKILLVEADSNSFSDLVTAVEYAAEHADVVSNSYGGAEFLGEAGYESYYNFPGKAITVSSGDSGYGAEFPAASQYVTAVGGTSLTTSSIGRGWSETAWSGAGSGCSRYITKPTWQADTGCGRRTIADVSAVADPNTGVAVYDSYGSAGETTGSSTEAPASPPRSSPAYTPWPGRPVRTTTRRRIRTVTPDRCSMSSAVATATATAAPTCATL